MTKQPKALILANILEHQIPSIACREITATELRRLHEVNQELLEALQNLCKVANNGHVASYSNLWDDAKAAIATATGEQA